MRVFLLLWFLTPLLAEAQGRQIDLRGSVGWTGFLDDSFVNHLATGVAGRFYLTRRLSVEPELQYLYQNSRHSDLLLVPNIAWDFGGQRIVPYVAGGVGLIRGSSKIPGALRPSFSNTEPFYQVGGGVKLYLSDRWFMAPDFRIGFEASLRFTVGFGYSWNR